MPLINMIGVDNMDDDKIIDLYWARSELAISETEKKYSGYCRAISYNILYDNEDAKECVNDTFLKTWEAIPPKRPSAFRGFLGKITRNLSLDKYRKNKAQKRGGGEIELLYSELQDCIPSGDSVESRLESEFVIQAINECLKSMKSTAMLMFVRRYWYADSIQVIAERFNMSESAVKTMLFRSRKKLKEHLEKEGVIL